MVNNNIELTVDYKGIKKAILEARYDELYQYAILTYDRPGRVAKERLEELKKLIEE